MIWHGRNLDYGHQGEFVELLKNLTINVDFLKGGKVGSWTHILSISITLNNQGKNFSKPINDYTITCTLFYSRGFVIQTIKIEITVQLNLLTVLLFITLSTFLYN